MPTGQGDSRGGTDRGLKRCSGCEAHACYAGMQPHAEPTTRRKGEGWAGAGRIGARAGGPGRRVRLIWTHSCIFEVLLRKTSLVVAFAERGGSNVSVLLTAASAAPRLPSTAIANKAHSNAVG